MTNIFRNYYNLDLFLFFLYFLTGIFAIFSIISEDSGTRLWRSQKSAVGGTQVWLCSPFMIEMDKVSLAIDTLALQLSNFVLVQTHLMYAAPIYPLVKSKPLYNSLYRFWPNLRRQVSVSQVLVPKKKVQKNIKIVLKLSDVRFMHAEITRKKNLSYTVITDKDFQNLSRSPFIFLLFFDRNIRHFIN